MTCLSAEMHLNSGCKYRSIRIETQQNIFMVTTSNSFSVVVAMVAVFLQASPLLLGPDKAFYKENMASEGFPLCAKQGFLGPFHFGVTWRQPDRSISGPREALSGQVCSFTWGKKNTKKNLVAAMMEPCAQKSSTVCLL